MFPNQGRSLIGQSGGARSRSKVNLHGRCELHPELDLDTICFNRDCRQDRSQIICCCCGQTQQPHKYHINEQHAIYKTAPGFRLLNEDYHQDESSSVNEDKQQISGSIQNLRAFTSQIVQAITEKATNIMNCYSDFLKKDGVYKICNRIRQESKNHMGCCIPLINELKDLEIKIPTPMQVRQLISQKIRREKVLLKIQVQTILDCFQGILQKMKKKNWFLRQKNLKPYWLETYDQSNILNVQKNIVKNSLNTDQKKLNKQCKPGNLRKQNEINWSLHQNNKIAINVDEPHLQQASTSLIHQLLMLDSQEAQRDEISKSASQHIFKRQKDYNMRDKNTQRYPTGLTPVGDNAVAIWNKGSNRKIIHFLSTQQHVKNLIIEDPKMANSKVISMLLKKMPWVKGLHINCKSQDALQCLKNFKLAYLSFLPGYQYIQQVDKARYFEKIKFTQNDVITHKFRDILKQHSGLKNIEITSSDIHIHSLIEEVVFSQDDGPRYWSIKKDIPKYLLEPLNLLILVFNNIQIHKYARFEKVFSKQSSLHTLVFVDCRGNLNGILQQVQHLKPNQLKHFELSGTNLDNQIHLQVATLSKILEQVDLQTLILTNSSIGSEDKLLQKNSSIFWKIKKLKCLTHLNLFDTEPVYNDLLGYLHNQAISEMVTLNLGCTEIGPQSVNWIGRMRNLRALCIDYTVLGKLDVQKITTCLQSLEYLSVQNLNGTPVVYQGQKTSKNGKYYGLITPETFKNMPFKTLKYVNIYNCNSLRTYEWDGFQHLQCVRINRGLLSIRAAEKLRSRNIKLNIEQCVDFQEQNIERQSKSCLLSKSIIKISSQNDYEHFEKETVNFQTHPYCQNSKTPQFEFDNSASASESLLIEEEKTKQKPSLHVERLISKSNISTNELANNLSFLVCQVKRQERSGESTQKEA